MVVVSEQGGGMNFVVIRWVNSSVPLTCNDTLILTPKSLTFGYGSASLRILALVSL